MNVMDGISTRSRWITTYLSCQITICWFFCSRFPRGFPPFSTHALFSNRDRTAVSIIKGIPMCKSDRAVDLQDVNILRYQRWERLRHLHLTYMSMFSQSYILPLSPPPEENPEQIKSIPFWLPPKSVANFEFTFPLTNRILKCISIFVSGGSY